ncbi:MAG: hypothetical protein P8R42_02850 [Candidatus Binatia bacterium]|nr:hypothetical protein [Candidatus Binatia bacterium]
MAEDSSEGKVTWLASIAEGLAERQLEEFALARAYFDEVGLLLGTDADRAAEARSALAVAYAGGDERFVLQPALRWRVTAAGDLRFMYPRSSAACARRRRISTPRRRSRSPVSGRTRLRAPSTSIRIWSVGSSL